VTAAGFFYGDKQMQTNQRFIKLPEVIALTGKARSTIYADIKNHTFPAPVKIGFRAVAWRLTDVIEWQESRIPAVQTN
jgi:prophage regulatory protein